MRLKALVQDTWKTLAGLTLLYLLVSLISGFYFTQSHYSQFIDQHLMTARSQIWLDGAEMGERPETQNIFILKSQMLLDQVSWHNPVQIFRQCYIVTPHAQTSGSHYLGFPFTFSLALSPDQTSDIAVIECQLQSGIWLVSSFVLAVLSIFLLSFQPRPLNSDDLKLLKQVRRLDGDNLECKRWKQAIHQFRETSPNTAVNQDYFNRLLNARAEQFQTVEDKVRILEQASRPLTLSFSVNSGNVEVRINEIVIPMSSTPAIYWLWYAKKRISEQNDGWVLNPPSNRPSQTLASELITLMENYGGHGRAISELKQHGLKAKTLDQNRNKIKDALVKVLGESFIEHLGFESAKHIDNAQSIYRLKISPNTISINGL
ncbi:hypothetical protein [Vibrio sp. EA2]|uniref:hypothetical protein n=1 Tax=Vibrio sp. EA2 TaxID=3079860 RepID=UPI00294A1816|nr:hypothetical protein [Vibrio sp. EA2]MDV6250385.1 hypothetical protein [Vibrio sp. EA2]